MTRPYGTWPSPLSAASIAAHTVRLSSVAVDGHLTYWLEGRASDGGRHVLVCCAPGQPPRDVTPAGFNVRTRVHEYGGGAYLLHDGRVYFSNFADQRLYVQDAAPVDAPGGSAGPLPITPEGAYHYADASCDRARRRLICIREDHTVQGREAESALVAVGLDGSGVEVLATGEDFYATPRVSPDGRFLCWLSWRHPRMPWDGTELWVAPLGVDGRLGPARVVAGGPAESVYQPGWLADGRLLFASDRDGWWRLYATDLSQVGASARPLLSHPPEATEFGRPQWILGTAVWVEAGADRLVVSFTREGRWGLGLLAMDAGVLRPLVEHLQPDEWLAASSSRVVAVMGSDRSADVVASIDLSTQTVTPLRRASAVDLEPALVSVARPISFPAAHGHVCHAFYYPPTNGDLQGAAGEQPPLVVIGHGGPIAAADPTFDVKIQYWTTRGFAVVDVNYGGSTGFGREYRRRLNGQWGIVDVADMVAAARHLVGAGLADPRRLIVRGGSAGGFTVLAALTQHPDLFGAGASYYGVSDLEALTRDSHKFESRCLDILVAPYPAAREEYLRRSPIYAVDRLRCPLIVLQGLDDKVVPPNQSDVIVEALRAGGRPVAYLTFEGEQHGFRKAESIVRSLEAELSFYGAVFGFEPADRLPPIAIDNAHTLPGRPGRPSAPQGGS